MNDHNDDINPVIDEAQELESFKRDIHDSLSGFAAAFRSGDYSRACRILTELCETLNSSGMEHLVLTAYRATAEKADTLRSSAPSEWAWFLNAVAAAQITNERFDEAEAVLGDALTIGEELSDSSIVSTALHNLGILAFYSGNRERAWAYYNESLRLKEEIGDKRGIAQLQNNLGSMAIEDGNYDCARGLLKSSLEIKRRIRDHVGLISAYSSLGNLDVACGDYQSARRHFARSLPLARKYGAPDDLALGLLNLGNVLVEHGHHDKALEGYYEGLKVARNYGLLDAEEMLQLALALALYKSGQYDEAMREFQQLAELKGRLGKRFDKAMAFHDAAVVAIESNNTEAGLDFYRQAVHGFYLAGDAAWRGRCMWEMASVLSKLGRDLECRSAINSSIGILRNAADYEALTDAYKAGVHILFRAGRPDWALELFRRESAYLEQYDDLRMLAQRCSSVAHMLLDYHLPTRALKLFTHAIDFYVQLEEKSLEALTRNDLALARVEAGRFEMAISDYLALIDDARSEGNRVMESLALTNLAEAQRRCGRYENAVVSGEQALELAEQLHDVESVPMLLNNLGLAYEDLENYGRAESCFRNSLDAARRDGDAEAQARALSSLGSLDARKGRYRRAIANYDKAFACLGPEPQQLALDVLRNRLICLIELDREAEASNTATQAVEMAQALGDYATAEDVYYRVAIANLQDNGLALAAESLVFSLLFAGMRGVRHAGRNIGTWVSLLAHRDQSEYDSDRLRTEVYEALERRLPNAASTIRDMLNEALSSLDASIGT